MSFPFLCDACHNQRPRFITRHQCLGMGVWTAVSGEEVDRECQCECRAVRRQAEAARVATPPGACRCGHSREHHAWGTGVCELVYPAWTCPTYCREWRPS